MDVCFDCLHDFARKPQKIAGLPPLDDLDEPDGFACKTGATIEMTSAIPKLVTSKAKSSRQAQVRAQVYVRILSPSVDLALPLPDDGMVIGRSAGCDVVLHARSVSRRHLRIYQDDCGVCVEDLGSTNAALLNGRELDGVERMESGDVLDVCGTRMELA